MFHVIAAVLLVLVGIALLAGGLQLWRKGAQPWPDIVAGEATARRTAGGMLFMAGLLLATAAALLLGIPGASAMAALVTIALVLAAYVANRALFGTMRATHTVTNLVIAAIILALLWFGLPAPAL